MKVGWIEEGLGTNNIMERLYGTVRERDKMMRCLDNDETVRNPQRGSAYTTIS